MPTRNQIEINRKGKQIGFLEIPEFPQGVASLPYLEGNDRGLAIVVEIDDAPAVALVFPWRGESIDIAEPVRWSAAHWAGRDVPVERQELLQGRSLTESPSLFQLAGEIRPSRLKGAEDIAFYFRFGKSRESRQNPIRLEIDEESEYGSLHCRLGGHDLFRGSLRAGSKKSDLRTEIFFDFRGDRHGIGNGYFTGQMRSLESHQSGRGDFRFWFDSFESDYGYCTGRFEGRGSEDFPLLWLIEQTFGRIKALERPAPFRIWIGAVRYAPEIAKAQVQLQRINALTEGGTELSGAETRESLQWLASSLLEPRSSTYARLVAPLLERLQVGEQASYAQSQALNTLLEGARGLSRSETSNALRLFASTLLQLRDPTFTQAIAPVLEGLPLKERAYRVPRIDQTVHDLTLQFDAPVSPEKRMRFLIALANQLSKDGGRLCFAQAREEQP